MIARRSWDVLCDAPPVNGIAVTVAALSGRGAGNGEPQVAIAVVASRLSQARGGVLSVTQSPVWLVHPDTLVDLPDVLLKLTLGFPLTDEQLSNALPLAAPVVGGAVSAVVAGQPFVDRNEDGVGTKGIMDCQETRRVQRARVQGRASAREAVFVAYIVFRVNEAVVALLERIEGPLDSRSERQTTEARTEGTFFVIIVANAIDQAVSVRDLVCAAQFSEGIFRAPEGIGAVQRDAVALPVAAIVPCGEGVSIVART